MGNLRNAELLKKNTLLYVEDEEDSREGLGEILRYKVKELYLAENGRMGLDLYDKHRPDIVITDIAMPVLDGLEMTRRIKLINRNAQVIIITAHGQGENFDEASDLGVVEFVLKPIVIDDLFRAIDKCIDRLESKQQDSGTFPGAF